MSNYDKIIKKVLMGAGIGAGVLGAGALAGEGTQYALSKLSDYPDDPAYNLYKEGKTIDQIKNELGEVDPKVLYTLLNNEEYLQDLLAKGDEDELVQAALKSADYRNDKSLYRIMNNLKGE